MNPDEYDPEATVWLTVAELEKKRFTKEEIVSALDSVADRVFIEGYHHG